MNRVVQDGDWATLVILHYHERISPQTREMSHAWGFKSPLNTRTWEISRAEAGHSSCRSMANPRLGL